MSTSNAIPEGRHDNMQKGNGSRPDGKFRRALLAGVIALALLLPSAGFAEEPAPAATPAKAAVTSLPTGFKRLAFGDRFKGVFPSHNPATFTRLRLGASLTDHVAGARKKKLPIRD